MGHKRLRRTREKNNAATSGDNEGRSTGHKTQLSIFIRLEGTSLNCEGGNKSRDGVKNKRATKKIGQRMYKTPTEEVIIASGKKRRENGARAPTKISGRDVEYVEKAWNYQG